MDEQNGCLSVNLFQEISRDFLVYISKLLDYSGKDCKYFSGNYQILCKIMKVILTKVWIDYGVDTTRGQNRLQPKRNSNTQNQSMTKGLNNATGMEKKNTTILKSVKHENSEMELPKNEDSLNNKRPSKPRLCKTKGITDETLLKNAFLTRKLNKGGKLENLKMEPGTSSGYKLNGEKLSKAVLSKKIVKGVAKSLKNGSPTGMKNKKNGKRIKSGEVGNLGMLPGTSARIFDTLSAPGTSYAREENVAAYKRKAASPGLDRKFFKKIKEIESDSE